MTPRNPPRLCVVRREEKESRLKEFIVRALETEGRQSPVVCSLVARSEASPVVRVIKELSEGAGLPYMTLQVVLMSIGDGIEAGQVLPGANVVLVAHDARLLDAHEQLVIGGDSCWIGDCMRRDPEKRDAFERYVDDCAETVRFAEAAFAHLIKSSGARNVLRSNTVEPAMQDVQLADGLIGAGGQADDVVAGTRH